MISLQEILGPQKRELIIKIAQMLGFVNVRLHKCDEDDYLHLIVDLDERNPDADLRNNHILATSLGKELECFIIVYNASCIQPEFRDCMIRDSIELNSVEQNPEKITQLFGENLAEKTFLEMDISSLGDIDRENYAAELEENLAMAEEIIKEWREREESSDPTTPFWSQPSRHAEFSQTVREIIQILLKLQCNPQYDRLLPAMNEFKQTLTNTLDSDRPMYVSMEPVPNEY